MFFALPQRLLSLLAPGDFLEGDQHLGFTPDGQPGCGKQESEVPGFPVNKKRQACFHLVMVLTGFQGVNDGVAYPASLTEWAEAAAFRIIQGMEAAPGLAAAPADQIGLVFTATF